VINRPEMIVPHRWWCGHCFEWRACGCFEGGDHSVPYFLDPVTLNKYLDQETRLHELASRPPAHVRNLRAWTRALSTDALALMLELAALAHARRCAPNGRQHVPQPL